MRVFGIKMGNGINYEEIDVISDVANPTIITHFMN